MSGYDAPLEASALRARVQELEAEVERLNEGVAIGAQLLRAAEDKLSKDFAARAVRVLNEALDADGSAVRALFAHWVMVNRALANHKTIQADTTLDGGCRVRLLGVINGIVGVKENGSGYVAAVCDVTCRQHGTTGGGEGCVVGEPCEVEGCSERLELGSIRKFIAI